jgi:L-ascorbate metabolism protein UlaG (beta-lactamase superfamily)
MIQPLLTDDAFLADVRVDHDPDVLSLWWLGQSGFLVRWRGRHLLLDPYLSDSLTKKYEQTDKPHVRMTARVVSPHKLDFIDVVTSSHNHTDHLDAETLQPLFRANPGLQLVIPEANRAFVTERLGLPADHPVGLDAGQSVTLGPFTFTPVPAAHEQLDRDEAGRCLYLGYVVQCGPWTIYHSGDTVRYPGMSEMLARWKLDLALLPINGRHPSRRVAGNLSGAEAAQLAKDIGADLVVPCHYEMFQFNTATTDEFVQAATRLGQPYRVLRAGEQWAGRKSRA